MNNIVGEVNWARFMKGGEGFNLPETTITRRMAELLNPL